VFSLNALILSLVKPFKPGITNLSACHLDQYDWPGRVQPAIQAGRRPHASNI